MNNKTSSMVILALGALLLLASLLADVIGIGDDAGFGRQQTMGTVAGVKGQCPRPLDDGDEGQLSGKTWWS